LAYVDHFNGIGVCRLQSGRQTVINVHKSVRNSRQRGISSWFLERIQRGPFVGERIVELYGVGELVFAVTNLSTSHNHALVPQQRDWSVEAANFHGC